MTINAAAALVAGSNHLAVRAENVKAPVAQNPAGLTVGLDIELADKTKLEVRSDSKWRAFKTEASGWRQREFDDSSWPAAMIAAKFGELPWGKIGDESAKAAITPQACGDGKNLIVVYAVERQTVYVHGLYRDGFYWLTHLDPVTGQRTFGNWVTPDADGSIRATRRIMTTTGCCSSKGSTRKD